MASKTWQLQSWLYGLHGGEGTMATRVAERPGWILTDKVGRVQPFAFLYRFFRPTGGLVILTQFKPAGANSHFPYGLTPIPYEPM